MMRNCKVYKSIINNKEVEVKVRKEPYGICVQTIINGRMHCSFTKNLSDEIKEFVNKSVETYMKEME